MPCSFPRFIIFFFSLIFFVAFLNTESRADQKKIVAPKTWTGVVRHVVDGDSLYLVGVKRQIRLWGVDAPELDESGYAAARRALTKKVKAKRLRCLTKDHDKYGRIVARCFLKTKKGSADIDINRWMITGGTAKEYCYFTKGYYGHCRK